MANWRKFSMKFWNAFCFGIAAATAIAAGPVEAKDWTKVTIATEGAYAPWNFMEANGKPAGFEVDLANELCKRMKVECQVVVQDWDGIIPALTASKYDAIMAGMNITDKRLEVINFSQAYASSPGTFAVLKDSPLAKMPDAGKVFSLTTDEAGAKKAIEALKPMLKGKVIGAQVSTTHYSFIEANFKDVAELRAYKTTEQHDLDLAAGRIDAAFAATSYFADVIAKPEGKDIGMVGPQFAGGILGRGVAVGLRKTDPDLKKMFDDAIKAAIADGTTKTLSVKWFKLDLTPQ
jgi:octopine/nopaline transport system substrate-binding protein